MKTRSMGAAAALLIATGIVAVAVRRRDRVTAAR